MSAATASHALRSAWNDWLNALAGHDIDAFGMLLPPASDSEIAEAEAVMSCQLPADLRDLYRLSNGQVDFFSAQPRNGMHASPLFGGYQFNTLQKMLAEGRNWATVRTDYADRMQDSSSGIAVRRGDPVKPLYTSADWIPFATDGGGNSLAVDLDPEPGGTRGQVIVIGSDEDLRRVIADSVTTFLTSRNALLAGGEIKIVHNLQDPEFFDIEGAAELARR